MSRSQLLALAVSGRGLVDPHEPVLLADDEGFTRGRAAFETMRVYEGRPFRLAEHISRLGRSSASIGLPSPDRAELEHLVALALGQAGVADLVLRLYWSPGSPGAEPVALVMAAPIPGWIEEVRARGQRLASLLLPRPSSPWLLPGTKSVSYAVNMAAEAEAKRRGADDAVFVDVAGVVLEGPVTNIWWREGEVLVTPSLELGILAGETRAAILDLAQAEGLEVQEGAFPLERLAACDEAFTSSSVREIVPVVELDGEPIARGPVADRLQGALRAVAEA